MSYRYEKLYIMHYGVGHDKGGHSGRYPWGSGKNPYGGVDPTTKKSDLFKLNGRKFNDVASDLIVKKKYGNRTDVTEEQIAQSKARTQAFLKGLEATIGTAVIGAVGGVSVGALQSSKYFDNMASTSKAFTDKYVRAQTSILDMTKDHDNIRDRIFDPTTDVGKRNLQTRNNQLLRNQSVANTVNRTFRNGQYPRTSSDVKLQTNATYVYDPSWTHYTSHESAEEMRTDLIKWWNNNSNVKTFENNLKSWDLQTR